MSAQLISEFRELLAWKHSECEGCEFTLSCPKGTDNLRACFEEDGLSTHSTTDALIKRTIRFLCKDRKKQRRQTHLENIREKVSKVSKWFGPRPMEAVMSCSDMEEFVACQKSG